MKSNNISELAPFILKEIENANHILLHCHPGPDGDSLGSTLATYHALKSIGKNVDVIRGDSKLPENLRHMPGFGEILERNFFEMDLSAYDLFIIEDAASLKMISRIGEVIFPLHMRTVIIDHHASNPGYADINLIDQEKIATSEIIYELLLKWGIKINRNIAECLFVGIYTDSGGFRYAKTTARTYEIVAELVKLIPDFSLLISEMDFSSPKDRLLFKGLALNSVEVFYNHVALVCISSEKLKENNINTDDADASMISSELITVKDWDIGISMVEKEPEKIRISMRSRNPEKFDVSKITQKLNGGGHKVAAGAYMETTIDEAKRMVLEAVVLVYPELK